MTKIKNILARQIFDSRGNPTVETDVITSNGVLGRAAVPSGASTGEHEAVELRDGTNDFMGKSVYHAVRNVNDLILKELKNLSVFDQEESMEDDSKDFKLSLCIKRILTSLRYSSLLNVNSDKDHQQVFINFIERRR